MYGSILHDEKRGSGDGNHHQPALIHSQQRLGACLAGVAIVTLTICLIATSSSGQTSIASPSKLQSGAPVLSLTATSALSSRGQGVQQVRDDIAMFIAGAASPFHPVENKDGYLVLLVAENKLMWKEMAERIQRVQSEKELPQWIFNYGDMGGNLEFKKSVAKVMQKWISSPVDPECLQFQAGAGSVLDQLSYLLADTNDGVLVTGPNYPAFVFDLGVYGRLGLHIAPTQPSQGYAPTIAELDDVFQRSVAAGNPPKILLICQPNNPTGVIYTPDSMHLMITWALKKGLHVVSDEIYALSVFPGEKTTSAADVMSKINAGEERYLGDYVHIVAGMSKDWGMSGFRVGTLFTHNVGLSTAFNTVAYYQSVSEYTQNTLINIFQDDEWVDWYIAENQKRLSNTYHALENVLSLINVPLNPATRGGLFAWADFSSYLKEGQTEKELWLELYEGPKILFTSGESSNGEKPGMFRIVYPWPEGGEEAMKELGDRLVKWKAERET